MIPETYQTMTSLAIAIDLGQAALILALIGLAGYGVYRGIRRFVRWIDADAERCKATGIAAGDSTFDLALRVEDIDNGVLGSTANRVRATTIARTEATGALNAGHHAAHIDLERTGVILGRKWDALLDRYTRDSHIEAEANGQVVKGSEMFTLTDPFAKTPYPGHYDLPAAHRVNCRCTVQAVTL